MPWANVSFGAFPSGAAGRRYTYTRGMSHSHTHRDSHRHTPISPIPHCAQRSLENPANDSKSSERSCRKDTFSSPARPKRNGSRTPCLHDLWFQRSTPSGLRRPLAFLHPQLPAGWGWGFLPVVMEGAAVTLVGRTNTPQAGGRVDLHPLFFGKEPALRLEGEPRASPAGCCSPSCCLVLSPHLI